MIKPNAKKLTLVLGMLLSLSACEKILEPVKLYGLTPDAARQENFEVNVEPLTFAVAKKLNAAKFERFLSKPGRAVAADVVGEQDFARGTFPPAAQSRQYLLGIGDKIALIQYSDAAPSLNSAGQFSNSLSSGDSPSDGTGSAQSLGANLISTTGRIGTDGSMLLLGVGRIEAAGRSIEELRDEVRSILIRNGTQPNFQLEISEFNSQKAFITTDGGTTLAPSATATIETAPSVNVIPITDRETTLRQLAATAGVNFNEKVLTLVQIQRGGKTYSFTLADLFAANAPEVYLQDQDHVFIQNLAYTNGKVFLIGGVAPKIISISPEVRQTMADVLFASGGPLATQTAQRSAVYLLRGKDPVIAYHIDAQNPVRVLVADAVELRPDDIVYVAEQPLSELARTLSSVRGLQALVNSIRNN